MSERKSPYLMIPGPTEVHEDILSTLGEPTPSHVAPSFIEEFGRTIENLRKVFLTKDAQPYVIAGSGSLGWDMISANLCEEGDTALVVHTGYFSTRYTDCLKTYKVKVEELFAAGPGHIVTAETVRKYIEDAKARGVTFRLLALTQVDTSTGVLNDIKGISAAVREVSPETFITVDGVCSFMGEEFRFDDWHIDAAFTGSQKALGVPPGLMVAVFSQRAVNFALKERKSLPATFYGSMVRWTPVMQAYEARKPSYFATPACNLVRALDVGVQRIVDLGIEHVFAQHKKVADAFRAGLKAINLSLLTATEDIAAHTLSAIRYPEGVQAAEFLPHIKAQKVVVAGGLHPDVKALYFRVGHMGVSTMELNRKHISITIDAIESAVIAVGRLDASKKGSANAAFEAAL